MIIYQRHHEITKLLGAEECFISPSVLFRRSASALPFTRLASVELLMHKNRPLKHPNQKRPIDDKRFYWLSWKKTYDPHTLPCLMIRHLSEGDVTDACSICRMSDPNHPRRAGAARLPLPWKRNVQCVPASILTSQWWQHLAAHFKCVSSICPFSQADVLRMSSRSIIVCGFFLSRLFTC